MGHRRPYKDVQAVERKKHVKVVISSDEIIHAAQELERTLVSPVVRELIETYDQNTRRNTATRLGDFLKGLRALRRVSFVASWVSFITFCIGGLCMILACEFLFHETTLFRVGLFYSGVALVSFCLLLALWKVKFVWKMEDRYVKKKELDGLSLHDQYDYVACVIACYREVSFDDKFRPLQLPTHWSSETHLPAFRQLVLKKATMDIVGQSDSSEARALGRRIRKAVWGLMWFGIVQTTELDSHFEWANGQLPVDFQI